MRWLLPAVVLLSSTPAFAVERHALLIGNNEGARDEVTLQYAESDARRMRDVLTSLGRFSRENVVSLEGATAEEARRALIAINERIRLSDDEAMLVVYYSGHADANALHLGDSEMNLDELERLVRGSAATYRMLILDACRSGALTRVKGGTTVAPFDLEIDERLAAEGVVFLTSTSANEDAQESDALKGSFFTHYLVSGMLGPADENDDGRVGLREAYDYAYQHTLRASSRTLVGPQHPTFNWEVRGKGDVTLTKVEGARRAMLEVPPGRSYLVMRGDEQGPVVAELLASGRARRMSLEPGRYFVRGRGRDHMLEGGVVLTAGRRTDLASADLSRAKYARLVRKGARTMVHGPEVGAWVRTALPDLGGWCSGLTASWAFEFSAVSIAPLASACTDVSGGTTNETSFGARVSRAFDLPVVTVEVGIAAGGALFDQDARDGRRRAAAPWTSAEARVVLPLGAGFEATTSGGAVLYLVEVQRNATVDNEMLVAGRFTLALGKRF